MARCSVAETRNNLTKLLARVVAGEEVTITRRGREIAKITPIKPAASPLGLDWLIANRVTPKAGADFDSAALIRQMRDEGY
jgi:prevent-host-death family protein